MNMEAAREGQTQSTQTEESSPILHTTSLITFSNRFDHFLARIGYRRMSHKVKPGLYSIGEPGAKSPVLVTGNYTLSFDALRCELSDKNAWILVLDTKGINVWCAAGKGTFGTDELVNRIKSVGLKEIVSHRRVIVPQLGGPGIAAHMVKKGSWFKVIYGPVKASDLPEFLETGEVTKEMRKVTFNLAERLTLIPVELKPALAPTVALCLALYILGGAMAATAFVVAVLSGIVLFPALLPYLPTSNFVTKGFLLGLVTALPFSYMAFTAPGEAAAFIFKLLSGATPLLLMPPVTAFLSLNFTGSTTYTSASGVRSEIFRYTRPGTAMLALGLLTGITTFLMGLS